MMKAKELMIGDWVRHANGTPMQVTMIDYTQDGGHFACGIPHCWEYNNKFEPIPLTPDILEKNGFFLYNEENKAYRLELAEGTFINADFKVEEPFVCIVNTCYQATPYCVYVHHLQHAMRLCGIEMDFKV